MNQATTELFYGIQNPHATASRVQTPWDGLATEWDAEHPVADSEAARIKPLLTPVRGKYPPHVLDIGCGTGRVLDLGIVSPDRYAGVDSSRAMLNILVRKHPKTAAVYPTDIREALAAGLFTPSQFDWVFLDSAVEHSSAERRQIDELARRAVVEISGGDWRVRDVSDAALQRIRATSSCLEGTA